MDSVNRYFGGQAAAYAEKSDRGLWRRVRRREEEAVFSLLGRGVTGRALADLGSGSGYYSSAFLARGGARALAVDSCPEMLASIRDPHITASLCDLCSFTSGELFPFIICAGALEFVSDPAAVMARARAIAAPGCVFAVLVPRRCPAGVAYKMFHCAHGVRARLFSPRDIKDMAEKNGWRAGAIKRVFPFGLVARLEPEPGVSDG